MTAPDLLPCPFCGGEARKWQDPSHSAAWFIGCDDGDRDCFGSINWAETEAEAIAAWNRRAAPALTSNPVDDSQADDPVIKTAAMTPEVAALVEQWDAYVESMGCVMGEVERMAQQMRDALAALREGGDPHEPRQ